MVDASVLLLAVTLLAALASASELGYPQTSISAFVLASEISPQPGNASVPAPSPSAGGWVDAASMETPRQDFRAVVLTGGPLQGQVLAVGGCCNSAQSGLSLSASELYNPATKLWRSEGSLQSSRWLFQGLALRNGSALAIGGLNIASGGVLNSTEIFNPNNGTWRQAASMRVPRQDFEAVLLGDGRVMAIGGFISGTETYNVTQDRWTLSAPMDDARASFCAVVLQDGNVIAIGGRGQTGSLSSSEVYNVTTGEWQTKGNMAVERAYFAAVELSDGSVLAAGGRDDNGRNLASCEVYNATSGTWSSTGSMASLRSSFQAVLLPDGRVLVMGGLGGPSGDGIQDVSILATAELWDSSTGRWQPAAPMADARYDFQAALLGNSSAIVMGGASSSGYTSSVEIYSY